jgi:hypothetical protein
MTWTTSRFSADPATPGSENTQQRRTPKDGYATPGNSHHADCPPGLGKPERRDCYTCRVIDNAYQAGYEAGRDDALVEAIYQVLVLRTKEPPMPNA